jgi:hypothetical protein
VSPTSVRVGDRVEVVASARGGEDGWLWGELSLSLEPGGPWELVDGPTPVPESRPPVWRLTLAPLRLGEQALPPIAVTARTAAGQTVPITGDGAVPVEVVSILAPDDDAAEPAPLRDPVGARGFPWEWVLPVAGLLLPAVIAAGWWWRGRGRIEAPGRPALPPFAELEQLAAELAGRVAREPAEGVCDRLAAGLRRYLERRTGEPAEEMTSFELRLLARRRGWPETSQRLVQRVMGVADGIRFGRRPSSETELRAAIDDAVGAAKSIEDHLERQAAAGSAAEAAS